MINRPDEYSHRNPDRAFVDADNVRGGRREVPDRAALYALVSKADQLKERVTVVHVRDEDVDLLLMDASQIGNASGWRPNGSVARQYPIYTPAVVNVEQLTLADGEIGETVTVAVRGSFTQNDAGPLIAIRLYRGNQVQIGAASTTSPLERTFTVVRGATPLPLWAVVDYAAGPAKAVLVGGTSVADERPPAVRTTAAPQAAETGFASKILYLLGHPRRFFGPVDEVPTTSAQVRALAESQLTSAGNQFILNTGPEKTKFSFWLPPGEAVESVLDLDNCYAELKRVYNPTPLTVNDAAGNPVAGTLYTQQQAIPYMFGGARHRVTVIPTP